MGEPGLVSRALLEETTKKVRELGLVVWVDAESHYSACVDRLAAQSGTPAAPFPFPIVRYRNSFLELMLALEPYGNGLNPEHVLVHLPGLNKDTVRSTPVFELYQAGKTFEKNLATLIREAARGEARPEEVEAFLTRGDLSLEGADTWLASLGDTPRDEFSLRVEALGVEEVAFALFRGDPRIAEDVKKHGTRLFELLQKTLGISTEWRDFMQIAPDLTALGASVLVASWLMAVEFVSDLGAPPNEGSPTARQARPVQGRLPAPRPARAHGGTGRL